MNWFNNGSEPKLEALSPWDWVPEFLEPVEPYYNVYVRAPWLSQKYVANEGALGYGIITDLHYTNIPLPTVNKVILQQDSTSVWNLGNLELP